MDNICLLLGDVDCLMVAAKHGRILRVHSYLLYNTLVLIIHGRIWHTGALVHGISG